MTVEIEQNPNDILLGIQYIDGTYLDENNKEEDLQMLSIGLLFFTISFIFE